MPADPYELTGDIDSHNAEVQSFVLLEPIGDGRSRAAMPACHRETRRGGCWTRWR